MATQTEDMQALIAQGKTLLEDGSAPKTVQLLGKLLLQVPNSPDLQDKATECFLDLVQELKEPTPVALEHLWQMIVFLGKSESKSFTHKLLEEFDNWLKAPDMRSHFVGCGDALSDRLAHLRRLVASSELSLVWRAINIIARIFGQLPLHLLTSTAEDKTFISSLWSQLESAPDGLVRCTAARLLTILL